MTGPEAVEWLKLIGLVGGGIGALLTFAKGVHEYTIKVRLQRFQQYTTKIKEFESTPKLLDVYKRVLAFDEHMEEVDIWDRIAYLVFLDDLGVMMYSGLISKYVVHNTWSDGIIRCAENKSFWTGIPNEGPSWRTFRTLSNDMKVIEEKLEKNPNYKARHHF